MQSGKDKEMDSRVGNLERSVAILQTTQEGMEKTLNKVASGLEELLHRDAESKAQKPFSIREGLQTILTTLSIFSLVIIALGYMIDTRAGVKAEPAVKVAELLMKDGEYYILKERVRRLEQAVSWTPQIVAVDLARK